MTIKSIEVYKKNLALTRPYTIATKTISDVESVFVEVALSNGIIGLGAANPAKEVVGEDADMSLRNLQSDDIQGFVGREIIAFLRGPLSYLLESDINFDCLSMLNSTKTKNLIEGFKKGSAATVTIVPVGAPDQKVALAVSLKGFTAGYDALQATAKPE